MANALLQETSPYLLQHAHNPVDWYPWGEVALKKAVAEDKPILLSIGYAACHWCHVMERESFEDPQTAELMNRFFVNIKIDREERPDLDHIYMDAVQAMTGSGGWPLNVFLTPALKPFYGGTYYPPRPAFNRPSWREVLINMHQAYQQNREEVVQQAERLTAHLQSANTFGRQPATVPTLFHSATQHTLAEQILLQADTEWGGFGNAPKFPQTFSLRTLLRHFHFTGDQRSLAHVEISLDKMIAGGIYDQAGGGFARYSTDIKWQAPHFEKMLYDNALLVLLLAEAYQVTGKRRYLQVIEETLDFVEAELGEGNGLYYSALDADSEGTEGKFYTWSSEEVDEVLGQDAGWFKTFYQVVPEGNWEGVNILWEATERSKLAESQSWSIEETDQRLRSCLQLLKDRRAKRERPLLDDKILLGWNALMNQAFSLAFAATGQEDYRQRAVKNMEQLEQLFRQPDGSWHHTGKEGHSRIPAFLDDYAALIQAYIHLQEITGNPDYLLRAKDLQDKVIADFMEEDTGFFFYTPTGQSDVVIRKKEVYDGAVPSGNALMAQNLQYLSIVFDRADWREQSRALLGAMGSSLVRYPGSFGVWAMTLQHELAGIQEWAIVGQRAVRMLDPLLKKFVPNKILQVMETNLLKFPLLSGKKVPENPGEVLFFQCKDYQCSKPVSSYEEFLANV
jgi:uncharacterized protein YyaL (SSP411 family)